MFQKVLLNSRNQVWISFSREHWTSTVSVELASASLRLALRDPCVIEKNGQWNDASYNYFIK